MKDWKQYCEAQNFHEEGMEPPPQQMGQQQMGQQPDFSYLDRGDPSKPWHQRGDEGFNQGRMLLFQAKKRIEDLISSLDQNIFDPADEEKEAGMYETLDAVVQDIENFKEAIG